MTDENTTAAADDQQTSATSPVQGGSADTGKGGNAATAAKPGAQAGKEPVGAAAAASDDAGAAGASDVGELQTFREMLAGGDEKFLKQLERYKSKEAISKAVREAAQVAKNAGKGVSPLTDKSTPEEIKAYREAVGIPDDPAAYPVSFRQDFEASEFDTEALSSFKEHMHGKHADPKTAAAAIDWFQDFAVAQRQELDGNMAKTAKATQAALRTEWGGEYDGNVSAAAQIMTTHLGEEGFENMMGLRLMDGSRLQDKPEFVKMMAQIGSDYYGGNAIITGDVETTSKTVEERINELMQLRASDSKKYFSDEVQGKLTKLYAQRTKLKARK
ncbi:hypothetical protein ABCW43_02315 [Neorhizobium sp. IRAMC:178]|uniref:hypothetical protein n=1 Tax=Neorhizobium tunisiense TaxID=3144793 RepID=UPI0031F65D91